MLAGQWTAQNYIDPKRQRLYLKDIDCPSVWSDKLKEQIPSSVFYLNDSVGDLGGAGAKEERYANGVGSRLGRGVAKAGDLMSCMPAAMRAENMMCYIGHEGTYTPAHREMCASLGQNIMVETSGSVGEDGKPTKPGSSIWFMTESKDRQIVSEYWLSALGHDIEVENHFASVDAWVDAPFKVWVVDQKVGDFILIPPLAPHQVWNRGTRTMKVAWNRTTVETLEMALQEALPRARMVCRDEQYKNKAIVLFTLNKYAGLLKSVEKQKAATSDETIQARLKKSPKIRQLEKDFRRLFSLFIDIMLSETFSSTSPEKRVEYVPYDSNITCSYCRCNIFNRFLTCKHCVVPLENGEQDTYDICIDCYAMGRSCKCLSKLTWVEQFPWKDLLEKYDIWRNQITKLSGSSGQNPPLSLMEERQRLGKKTLAEVCQEQLKLRPFKDPTKHSVVEDDSVDDDLDDVEVNDDGTIKNKPKKRPEKWYKDHPRCHICCHRHVRWKMATCSCGVAICYGTLWRGFDTMPQAVMEDPEWQCPKCRKICTCRDCIKDQENLPYEPKGTLLGHDTRKFADPRSTESLVDFSVSNRHWLKKLGDDNVPQESRRMLRHLDQAAMERGRNGALGDHYVNPDSEAAMAIDPQLAPADSTDEESDEPVGIQQAATDALNMMGGLTALEREPEAFIAQAGLRAAAFPEQDYEYPDPDGSPGVVPTTEVDDMPTTDKKRKRARDAPLVQSDAPLSEANKKFQRQQAQIRIKEARRQGHYISSQAAIRGRRLIVKIQADPFYLAQFPQGEAQRPMAIEPELDNTPVIVQSDLPKGVPDEVAQSRNPQVRKKRQRDDEDGEFTTSKRAARGLKVGGGHKLRSDVNERPEDSELDAEGDLEEDVEMDSPKAQPNAAASGRSLPSYLARRSPVNTTELPKELTGAGRRRSKPSVRKSIDNTSSRRESETTSQLPSPAIVNGFVPVNGNATVGASDGHATTITAESAQPAAPTANMAQILVEVNGLLSKAPARIAPMKAKTPELTSSDNTPEPKKAPAPKPITKPISKPSNSLSANMKAKLIASGVVDMSESDYDSEDSLIEGRVVSDLPQPTPVKRRRGRPPKKSLNSPAGKQLSTPQSAPQMRSILSKSSRGGKVKITSARKPAKA